MSAQSQRLPARERPWAFATGGRRDGRPRCGPTSERFWEKVDRREADGCWPWLGARCTHGYGNFWANGKHVRASRFSWEQVNGPIKNGMFVCHRCDNPACVNPSHLFLGTPSDNARDMTAKGRGRPPLSLPQTRCHRGHALTGHNNHRKFDRRDGRTYNSCRECANAARRRRVAAAKERSL